MLHIDKKYTTDGEHITNKITGEPIPADEPLILFRGRDRLLLPLLEQYKQMCVKAGSLPKHLELLDQRINDIKIWQAAHSGRLNTPGSGTSYAPKS